MLRMIKKFRKEALMQKLENNLIELERTESSISMAAKYKCDDLQEYISVRDDLLKEIVLIAKELVNRDGRKEDENAKR